jgi:di/tricarboxylate transporter
VGRSGARLQGKIGDIVLQSGDQLLLEAHPSWHEQQRNSRDFYLVSRLDNSTPPGHEKAAWALGILVVMVLVAGMEWLSMMHAALLGAGAMLASGCCNVQAARRSIDWEVLVTIAAALGVGETMRSTGLAQSLATSVVAAVGDYGPWFVLAAIYATTMVLTELLSNNATAALMYPIAMATAASLGCSALPFVMVVLVAASCGFATPIGYQTNLMVYGPGGYRFTDFLKVGLALDLVVMATALVVIPLVWPLDRLLG